MDAFFASVEERDFPEYRGKPVVVGGDPKSRGVVSTANYEARKYGVHSAMPTSRAYKLCPHAIFVYPRFSAYIEVSNQIKKIFEEYTDKVEPLSLDEAYLDVTENKKNIAYATILAKEIKNQIVKQTKLTASAGVSYNKFLAKIASGLNKPDGLTIVTPETANEFIEKLSIGSFFGIGKVTEQKMKSLGIHAGSDLKKISEAELIKIFGKSGAFYYRMARGQDDRPVENFHVAKSVGAENTFSIDLLNIDTIKDEVQDIANVLVHRLQKSEVKGRTLTLKVKYEDFVTVTRSKTGCSYTDDLQYILKEAMVLLKQTEAGIRKIRLIGLSISNLDCNDRQLCLPMQ
ncbi:MAG: DNA polymerase IV [Leptospiraceae bacterium]|nr:DNA polymerase IV [Leptospiraceae bacterium]